ncbi:hypothetical protein PFMG_00540 [Plasmodium falciparum IGH-CR14]|uniref:Pfmc-2TM Maurer's cleft two transmembrane protein n=1 Tax=Plasmodium falciparum IGH-CR14 TaxID=580059 RepID=A0A0L1I474_PLAFA|nr:hypothetical protein PFMG_00540 [Plasmodium falciparum IGH-CR14]
MLAQKNENEKSNGNTLKNTLLKDKSEKGSKKKNPYAKISDLVNLVDNMNITKEKKDEIKNLTLKYMNSDDIKEKNKLMNEFKKYSNNEECKEHMNNYLMYLRMQNDIKFLKKKNFWNNIWINSITLFLIIIFIACIFDGSVSTSSIPLLASFLLIFIIYIFARFFPDMKMGFKKIKETCTNFFQKKKK